MATLYRIRNWDKYFENSKSRERERCSFCCIPNKQDGLGYGMLIRKQNGEAMYGAFVAMVLVCSKQWKRNGWVTSDGTENGKPLTPLQLSIKCQFKEETIAEMLKAVSSEDVGWVDVMKSDDGDCPPGADGVPAGCPRTEGREGTEVKGTEDSLSGKPDVVDEGKGTPKVDVPKPDRYHKDSRTVLHILNEKTGRHFRGVHANLRLISQRLNEPEVDLDGFKAMIERQCAMWKNTDMEEYLRPETLFNATKFQNYYANRNMPANKHGAKPNPRNDGVCKAGPSYGDAARKRIAEQKELAEQMAGS